MGIIDDEEGDDFWQEAEEGEFDEDIDEPESFDTKAPLSYNKNMKVKFDKDSE